MDSNEQALIFDQTIKVHLQQANAHLQARKNILLSCLSFDRLVFGEI